MRSRTVVTQYKASECFDKRTNQLHFALLLGCETPKVPVVLNTACVL